MSTLTNCGQSDKAKVGGIQERPVLPVGKQSSAAEDIANHQKDA